MGRTRLVTSCDPPDFTQAPKPSKYHNEAVEEEIERRKSIVRDGIQIIRRILGGALDPVEPVTKESFEIASSTRQSILNLILIPGTANLNRLITPRNGET